MRNKPNSTMIIAEIGVNHNGSIYKAKKLIDCAKLSGANYVKFQYYKTDELTVKDASKAPYQVRKKINKAENQYDMLKKYELSESDLILLYKYALSKKINFMLSFFSESCLSILKKINCEYIKIPSGENDNYSLLKKIANQKKKVIFSTGMSNLDQIKKSLKILSKKISNDKIILLHCISSYPTHIEKINLNSISLLKNIFNTKVGLSDHTTDTSIPSYAIANQASVIEKHLTYSNKASGPDHKSSLNPKNFKIMTNKIRHIEKLLGSNKIFISKEEKININYVRKSYYYKNNYKIGTKINLKSVKLLRPRKFINPGEEIIFKNKLLKRNVKKNQPVNIKDFK